MKVSELIKLLQKCNPEKEVEYDSYSEGISMCVDGVTEEKDSVLITELSPANEKEIARIARLHSERNKK